MEHKIPKKTITPEYNFSCGKVRVILGEHYFEPRCSTKFKCLHNVCGYIKDSTREILRLGGTLDNILSLLKNRHCDIQINQGINGKSCFDFFYNVLELYKSNNLKGLEEYLEEINK